MAFIKIHKTDTQFCNQKYEQAGKEVDKQSPEHYDSLSCGLQCFCPRDNCPKPEPLPHRFTYSLTCPCAVTWEGGNVICFTLQILPDPLDS